MQNDSVLETQLAKGVDAGVINAEQRSALLALAGSPPQEAEFADPREESFRLVGGANDVLVGLGIILLLVGAASAVLARFGVGTVWTWAALAALCLVIAELITRRFKMKFASLVLASGFTVSVIGAAGVVIYDLFSRLEIDNPFQMLALREDIRLTGWALAAILCLIAAIHLWRYRVPVMAAVIAASFAGLCGLVLADVLFGQVLAVNIQPTDTEQMRRLSRQLLYFPLVVGIVIFAIGIAMDVKDRHRENLWSDCAFWMHVVSAPLMVHPLFVLATGQDVIFGGPETEGGATGLVIAFILIFLYLALIIDRRSLLVPSLAYFGTVGIATLVDATSQTTGVSPFAIVLLVLGGLIVLFGTGWHRIRGLVVRLTLPHLVANRLPPIKP